MQREAVNKLEPQDFVFPPGLPTHPNNDPIMIKTSIIAKMDIGPINP